MAYPVRAAIIETYRDWLEGISVADGYHTNVRKVIATLTPTDNITEHGAIQLIDRGDVPRRSVQLVSENRLRLEAWLYGEEGDESEKIGAGHKMLADFEKRTMEEPTIFDLAIRTEIFEAEVDTNALGGARITARRFVEIAYRTERNDPSALGDVGWF